jgi:hypothetical protein
MSRLDGSATGALINGMCSPLSDHAAVLVSCPARPGHGHRPQPAGMWGVCGGYWRAFALSVAAAQAGCWTLLRGTPSLMSPHQHLQERLASNCRHHQTCTGPGTVRAAVLCPACCAAIVPVLCRVPRSLTVGEGCGAALGMQPLIDAAVLRAAAEKVRAWH